MKSNSVPRVSLTAVLAFGLHSSVFAQVSPAPSNSEPREVPADRRTPPEEVVEMNPFSISETSSTPWNSQQTFSGSRVAQNVMDIPTSMAIINSEFIRAIGATNLLDVLKYAGSGVNSRVSYRDDFSIRGFRQGPLMDGIPFPEAGPIPLYNVDRLEIVKGPTALVYGNFSVIGGAINYVTKRPTATPSGEYGFGIGNDDFYTADLSARGPLNPAATVRYSVTVGAQYFEGFKDKEYQNNRQYSPAVDWFVSDKLLLRFNYIHNDLIYRDSNRSLVDPVTQKIYTGYGDDFSTSSDWSKNQQSIDVGRAEAIFTPGKEIAMHLIVNNFESHYLQFVPQPFPGLDASQSPNYTTIGQRFLYYEEWRKLLDIQADVKWTHDFSDWVKNSLNFGYAFNHTEVTAEEAINDLPAIVIAAPYNSRPPAPKRDLFIYDTHSRTRDSLYTLYANEQITTLHDHLILTGGVRYVPISSLAQRSAKWIPRLGAVYKVNNEISIYYSQARSFVPQTGKDVFGTDLQDVAGRNEEVGIKLNLFNGHLFGSAAFYDMLNNPVTTQVQRVVNGTIIFGNAQVGRQTNRGAEADLGGMIEVGPGHFLLYATTEQSKPRDQFGNKPARVVATKTTLFGRYEFMHDSLKGLYLGGGASHFGSQIGTGIPLEPAYTQYSVVSGYSWGRHWSVALNVDNVTNRKHDIVGSEASFSVYLAQPLSAKFAARYRW